jgi:hypothetical protein
MLLKNSSPRQFVKCLALLLVLSVLCGCGKRNASLYPPKSASSNIPAQTPPSANTLSISPREAVLAPVKSFHPVGSIVRLRLLSNASLVTPAPYPISISVSPTRASLYPNQTLQLTAAVTGTTHHAVKWLVEGHEGGDRSVGTVSAAGVYTAPPGPAPWPSVTITAVSAHEAEAFASAVVTMMPAPRDEQH